MTKNILFLCTAIVAIGLADNCSDAPTTVRSDHKPSGYIIEQGTDQRGFTSIVFVEGKDTFGLDYLTKNELDSVKLSFNQ